MKLLGCNVIINFDQDNGGEGMPKLDVSAEDVLVHCNLVNSNYQEASKVLFTLWNKQFGQLIAIAPHSLTMLNTTNTEISPIEVWFTDKNGKQLEDNVNITLIIG